jgi:hypothetical protein
MDSEELDYIHRNVPISIVGASTRIENAVLTDAEVDWIAIHPFQDANGRIGTSLFLLALIQGADESLQMSALRPVCCAIVPLLSRRRWMPYAYL